MGYDGLCIFRYHNGIVRDTQRFSSDYRVKRFVFSIKDLAPFIAAIVCILVFKHRKEQLAGIEIFYQFKSD